MEYEFDYGISNEEKVTQQVLYANAKFSIKDVLSDNTNRNSSVSVITPTQMVSVDFKYRLCPGGHAGMTDIILSRIYPDYVRSKYWGDQSVYFRERENNIFVACDEEQITIILPSGERISQMQYECLKKLAEEIKESDNFKDGTIEDIFFDDIPYDLDEKIASLKGKITEKSIPLQYPISKLKFSYCKSDKEYMDYAKIYAKKLHGIMENNKRTKERNVQLEDDRLI